MTRVDLAGKWYDLQVRRGLISDKRLKTKQDFIRRVVNGVRPFKPMTKMQLQCAVNDARRAL